MIVKVYRRHGAGVDRAVIDDAAGEFSWEGQTPQFIADLLGDRREATFSATFEEEAGRLILRLEREVAA